MNEEGFMRARSWEHCHHPEEMKEKCWCEYENEHKNDCVTTWDEKNSCYDRYWKIKFCPHCGKKL